MYLILQLYSLINLNVVSWGTREAPSKPAKQTAEVISKVTQNKPGGRSNAVLQFLNTMENRKSQEANISFSLGNLFRCLLCTHDTKSASDIQLVRVEEAIRELSSKVNTSHYSGRPRRASELSRVTEESVVNETIAEVEEDEEDLDQEPEEVKIIRDDLRNPYWIEDPIFRNCPVVFLSDHETTFWKELLKKYLQPLEKNAEKEARISNGLKMLRDKTMFGVLMLNAIFLLTIFLLQLNKDKLSITLPFRFDLSSPKPKDDGYIDSEEEDTASKLEPVGASFIICFAIILIIQLIGMFKHRLSTISHILAFVQLDYFGRKKLTFTDDEYIEKNAIEIAKDLQCLRGIDEEDNQEEVKDELGQKKPSKSINDANKSAIKGDNQSKRILQRKNTIFNLERNRERKEKTLTLDVAFRKRFLSLSSQDNEGLSRFGGNLRRRQAIEALERRRDRLLSASTWWIDNQTERSSSSVTTITNGRSDYSHNRVNNRFREIINTNSNPVNIYNDIYHRRNLVNNNSYSVLTRPGLRTFGHYMYTNNSDYPSSSEAGFNNHNNWRFNNV